MLGGVPHWPILKRAGETIELHVVDELALAVLDAAAHLRQVRRQVHVLHAASHHAMRVAKADHVRGLHHGFKAGAADLIHSDRIDGLADSSLERRLASRILPNASLQHVAHDARLHMALGGRGVLEQRLDGITTQNRCRNPREAAEELADRGATGCNDDGLVHG